MLRLPPKPSGVGIRPEERVCLDARRHSVVLFRPLSRAVGLSATGILLLLLPWPLPVAGSILQLVAAAIALVAVVRWDRTRLVITTEKVFLVRGVVRRRASAVMLRSMRSVSLEQSLPGRVLGYGTLQAGPLEVEYVPRAQHVRDLVERLAA
ncbi:MAG TPA: PH domain-containing protein [Gaiellaceae bacterium]|nr:PH domain-containing protein [Gaiellaceae bacterium]